MMEANESGQVLALLLVFGFVGVWAAIAVRREKVRDRQRLRRLAKVSDPARSVRDTSRDRSEA
jgi:hypothetical protein